MTPHDVAPKVHSFACTCKRCTPDHPRPAWGALFAALAVAGLIVSLVLFA